MPLSPEQITTLYKKPLKADQLARGQRDNERLDFLARVHSDPCDAGPYWTRFKSWVQELLGDTDKLSRTISHIRFPHDSSILVDNATNDILAFYKADDRYIDISFADDVYKSDFEAYLNQISFDRYIENDLFDLCLATPNGVMVVDMPDDGAVPAIPYFYFLDFGSIKDIEVDNQGNVLYVLWVSKTVSQGGEQRFLIAVDDRYFWKFDISDGKDPELIAQNSHGLSYCPVTFIWHDVQKTGKIVRRNSISTIAAKLDQLILDAASKRYADGYAMYPIMYNWDVSDPLRDIDKDLQEIPEYPENDRELKTEKQKKPSKLIGPGSLVSSPISPSADGNAPNLPPPVGFVNADTNNLKHISDELIALKDELRASLTGQLNTTDKNAVNTDQVRSQYESRLAVLKYWSENFEKTHEFLLKTIAQLRYGDQFKGCTVNYGDSFFLIDKDTALKEYSDAKNASLPQYILGIKRDQVEKIETKNNPTQAQRIEVLRLLEPYPDLSINATPPGTLDYVVKIRFGEFINRFELENGPIEKFGIKISAAERIRTIKNQLYQYAQADSLWEPGQGQGLSDGSGATGSNQGSNSQGLQVSGGGRGTG